MNRKRKDKTKRFDKAIKRILDRDPEFAAGQLRRIVAMARVNLPPFRRVFIKAIVDGLGGVNLPVLETVPWDDLADVLAKRVHPPELADFIRQLEPFEAYVLLICAELAGHNRRVMNEVDDEAFFPLDDRD